MQCELILAAPTLSGISWGTGVFGGTGPSCYWVCWNFRPRSFHALPSCSTARRDLIRVLAQTDNSTLTLQLGYAATLAVGDAVDVNPFAIMRGSELSSAVEPGSLPPLALPASGASAPRVSLSAPRQIGPCDPMVLDGALSDNGGGRQLFFTWTLISPTGTAQADQISALLAGEAPSSSLAWSIAWAVSCWWALIT